MGLMALLLPWLLLLASSPESVPSLALEGAHVWNGTKFIERDLFIEDGVFVAQPTRAPDRVVALDARWVIPPLGDAHVHTFSHQHNQDEWPRLIDRGIMFMGHMGRPFSQRSAATAWLNEPGRPEVLFANGFITCSGGHPIQDTAMWVQLWGGSVEDAVERYDGDWFHCVDAASDVDGAMDRLLETQPDLIKVILSFSELWPQFGEEGSHGIDALLLPKIVKRAHAAGLRVAVHVDTAADFRGAVAAGADLLAHCPGYLAKEGDRDRYLLEEEDIRAAVDARVCVVTTAALHDSYRWPQEMGLDPTAIRTLERNLRLLGAAGVPILPGSDGIALTAEVGSLLRLELFTEAELLVALTETTPRWLFPERDLGRLGPGAC